MKLLAAVIVFILLVWRWMSKLDERWQEIFKEYEREYEDEAYDEWNTKY